MGIERFYDANDIALNAEGDRPACEGVGDQFELQPYQRAADKRSIIAKRICQTCPIIDDCRDLAEATNEKHMIMGGELPSERRKRLGKKR